MVRALERPGPGRGLVGAFKNLALVNWGHDYHHFVGLVRETLVATFAVVAHNFHAQRTWAAKVALTKPPKRHRHRPAAAVEVHVALPSSPSMVRKAAPGPKGLEFLGQPRAGPTSAWRPF